MIVAFRNERHFSTHSPGREKEIFGVQIYRIQIPRSIKRSLRCETSYWLHLLQRMNLRAYQLPTYIALGSGQLLLRGLSCSREDARKHDVDVFKKKEWEHC